MKNLFLFIGLLVTTMAFAQIDKEQLSLDVSKADAANTQKLMSLIWKRYSTATISGEVKATVINEVSFNEKGEIQVNQVGGETSVKQKPGLRGKMQASAAEDKMEYVEEALKLSMAYTYMSKGQLLDFFEKAIVVEENGIISASAKNVYVTGDMLTIKIDAATNLFVHKKFSSFLDKDPVDGEIKYDVFSSGISHATTTVINLPAEKTVINAENKDYSQRVK